MQYKKYITNIIICTTIAATLLMIASCKKFVDTGNPKTSVTGEIVFSGDITATAAMTSIYGRMMSTNGYFASGNQSSIASLAGLSSDEWIYTGADQYTKQFNENALQPDNGLVNSHLWKEPYQFIYIANKVIEGVHDNVKISENVRNQLEGEAKFVRAFCHFCLMNMFGAIPYVTATDYTENSTISQSPATEVSNRIIEDLESAATLLSDDYMNARNTAGTERVRPNKATAHAMLARAYLYAGQWDKAEELATQVIEDPKYSLCDLAEVFLKNSSEAIWQLQPVTNGLNTWEAYTYIQPGTPYFAILSETQLNAFEPGDQRKKEWIAIDSSGTPYAYPFKYKIQFDAEVKEYSMVIRLAEMYLIRAEARIQQDKITEGIADINVLRQRATDITADPVEQLQQLPGTLNKEEALDTVLHERQVELFTEWGHRWFDLKRTGKIDNILSITKTGWITTDQLYPIPQDEMQFNPTLKQNDGY